MSSRFALALAATLAVLPAQEANPVRWSFGTPAVEGKPASGAVLRARLKAEIQEGWHLYSLKKLEGGPIPTRITLPAGQPFSLAGEIEAPQPEIVQDPVFEMEVEYYSGTAEFVVPVKIAAGAAGGQATLKIAARFQTCTEKICLPPRVVTLETSLHLAP